jgi:heavy metal translocating P-type ATPase
MAEFLQEREEHDALGPDAASRSGGITGTRRSRLRKPPIYWFFAWALASLFVGGIGWLAGQTNAAEAAWLLGTVPIILFLVVAIIQALRSGRVGVDAIALVSMVAALVLSQSLAAIVVAIMYAGGNVLEAYAVGRAERDLSALQQRAPAHAHRIVGETIEQVPIAAVVPEDRLLVKPGEIVPVDGTIMSPEAELDEAAMTGEPLPVLRRKGETARSGTVNAGGAIEITAVATSEASTYAGLLRLVASARGDRGPFVRMADRYATVLLPFTLLVAGLAWWWAGDAIRGLAVLVVATPCPLILAAPIGFISGISRTARRGVLLRGGRVIEALAEVRTVIFDKTGTLTEGGARLIALETSPDHDAETVLKAAASLESASHHSLAAAVIEAAKLRDIVLSVPTNVRETHGAGVEGIVEGRPVAIGSLGLVAPAYRDSGWVGHALRRARDRGALPIFVAIDGELAGVLLMADRLRPEAAGSLRWLRALGMKRLILLTGDTREAAERIAASLSLDAIFSDCTPEDKLRVLHDESVQGPVLMVGDGINDAPALAAARVGLALGARGGSAASQSADAVLLVDSIDRIPEAVRIARHTRKITQQSVIAGLAMSLAAMAAAALGYLPPVAGALTQEAIDVAVILNALRALGPVSRKPQGPAADDRIRIQQEHRSIAFAMERLEELSDGLERISAEQARPLLDKANSIIRKTILDHERQDDCARYFDHADTRQSRAVMTALGYAHGEIFVLAHRLETISRECAQSAIEPSRLRDAQRIIDELVLWVRLHNVVEDALTADD